MGCVFLLCLPRDMLLPSKYCSKHYCWLTWSQCPIYYTILSALTSACHAQDQATTTLHEFTHAPGVYSPGARDYAYGYRASAALTSFEAVNNADSYSLYANGEFSDSTRSTTLAGSSVIYWPANCLHLAIQVGCWMTCWRTEADMLKARPCWGGSSSLGCQRGYRFQTANDYRYGCLFGASYVGDWWFNTYFTPILYETFHTFRSILYRNKSTAMTTSDKKSNKSGTFLFSFLEHIYHVVLVVTWKATLDYINSPPMANTTNRNTHHNQILPTWPCYLLHLYSF